MEGQGGGEDAVAADAPEVWCLDVTAHRLYIRQQLQRGLKMFCSTSLAEEASSASSGGSLAEALHVPFMEPPAVASPSSQEEQQPGTDFLPLPLKVKEDLISRVILPCLRRRQCTGWVSAAPQVEAEISLTERGSGYPRRKRVDESSQKPAMLPPATTASAAAESRAHCDLSALGFSSNLTENATATALSTCSGLQALALLEALPVLSEEDLQQLRRFVLRLQRREDGAFANTLHPECRTSWCRTCSQPLAGASPPTATTAEAKGEVKWENEGDVRCTFCCLLSLKLIHAAAKAHQKRSAASHLLQTCAVTARAVGSVGGEAPVAVTPGAPFPGEPEVCRELPADPGPRLVQPPEDPIYATSWETFLQDPLAGVRVDATFSWLLSLLGPDGGVGVSPGAEPHAGAAFCFAGCLSLLGKRDALGTEKARRLERWLRERQLPEGSLQGRPGKKGDSCYTFWVTAALLLLGKEPLKVLNAPSLAAAVAAAQHPSGGISRVPAHIPSAAQKCRVTAAACGRCTDASVSTKESNGDDSTGFCSPLRVLSMGHLESAEEQLRHPDPFHTFFALAGLSLLAHSGDTEAKQPEQQLQEPHQHIQQHLRWQATCKQLLQPLDPETALPLQLANSL